jgi:hypothetical protein
MDQEQKNDSESKCHIAGEGEGLTLFRERIKFFVNKIAPRNWRLCITPKDNACEPGTLNIWLEILDCPVQDDNSDDWCVARVRDMIFFPAPRCEEGDSSEGVRFLADVQLEIFIDKPYDTSIAENLVHELSHIAELRLKAWKMGREMRIRQQKIEWCGEEVREPHGPLFLQAFRRMIARTENVFGSQTTKKMWEDFSGYEDSLKTEKGGG